MFVKSQSVSMGIAFTEELVTELRTEGTGKGDLGFLWYFAQSKIEVLPHLGK